MTKEPGNTARQNTVLAGQPDFPTTRWALGIAAADPHRKEARSAFISLSEGYWYPLYAYVRRRGYPADQAQDLTQEFFIRVLEGRYLDRADPEKGRFRAFLLTSMKFFLADEADRNRAQKRGGRQCCASNSRPAKTATNASLRTIRRQSGSSNDAGRFPCSIESWRNCGTSSCVTAVRSISNG